MKRLSVLLLLLWSGAGQAAGQGFSLPENLAGWWLTPDQQGQRLFEQGRFREAAEQFEDPAWRAAAYYRAGEFEKAAGMFGRLRSPEAAFNRGNALVLLGNYDEAIASYQRALELRSGWPEAWDNLDIAIARKQKLAPPESDAEGTGGMLEADEIVFDDSGRVDRAGTETETGGGETMSDAEMRAVWLRRVQNDPADFLRARFAWQRYRQSEGEADEAPAD
jgi:Ca-activated chloride channel family protein